MPSGCLCIADDLTALFYIDQKGLTDKQQIENAMNTVDPTQCETFLGSIAILFRI